MRQLYLRSLRTILASTRHGDTLVAGWITDKSAAELELPIKFSFKPFAIDTKNPVLAKVRQDKADAELGKDIKALESQTTGLFDQIDKRRIMRTAIIDSLDLAERVFPNYRTDKKVLVLMSDMIEDSHRYNFERESLAPERRAAIIEQLRKSGELPDLQGVRVFVIGATHQQPDRARRIREFWFELFSAGGAELRKQDYGGPLIEFNP
jgi:hypothetical protein